METELLEALIQKAVDHCFEDDISKIIASNALWKSANLGAQSLQFLALKAMVAEKRKVDRTTDVLFRLIFKEWLDISYFQNSYSSFDFESPKACQGLANDPYVMYAFLQQNRPRSRFDLIITMTHLIIKNGGMTMATIPNKDDQMFDTFWADRFFKLCLKMGREVLLTLRDESVYDVDVNESMLDSFIDSVTRITPAEGWEEAFAKGELIIYERKYDSISYTEVSTYFARPKRNTELPPYNRLYAFQV